MATTTDQLTDLLQRLNSGEDPAGVREEARRLLATLDPADLALAEQKLIDAGLAPEDLRGLCSIHLEVLGDQLEAMRADLAPGHVVHTLVAEHDMILQFLRELERVNAAIQRMDRYDPAREEFGLLHHLAEHLVGAEKHHQREEDVLFPEVEARGVYGPPQIMRMDHDTLRPLKHELLELAEQVAELQFAEFQRRVNAAATVLVPTLTEHIWKENNILYPTALKVIPEDSEWVRMKAECDEIGYCCFTPEL